MARRSSDIYWKGILEDLFADFLRFFYINADQLFDINRGFEFLDKELEQLFPQNDPEHPKFVDKLVKVFTREGKEEWILIHIEVQGYKDNEFAERMFTYFYRIRDRYNNRVRSIAIFTDSNKRFYPTEYRYQEGDTSIVFKFRTYKIIEQDQKLLEQSDNPFAIVILTAQLALRKKKLQDDYFNLTMDLVRRLYRKGFEKKKISVLIDFIRMYVNFDKPEISIKFDEAVDQLNNKIRTMGIREQILQITKEEATREKNIAIIKKLLVKGNYSLEEIAEIAEVSIDFVLKIKKQLPSK